MQPTRGRSFRDRLANAGRDQGKYGMAARLNPATEADLRNSRRSSGELFDGFMTWTVERRFEIPERAFIVAHWISIAIPSEKSSGKPTRWVECVTTPDDFRGGRPSCFSLSETRNRPPRSRVSPRPGINKLRAVPTSWSSGRLPGRRRAGRTQRASTTILPVPDVLPGLGSPAGRNGVVNVNGPFASPSAE